MSDVSHSPYRESLTRAEVLARLTEILSGSFEIDKERIVPSASLYEELDLDSIDAIDIFTQLRELTGRRPDPADARQVQTVDQLIDFVFAEIERAKAGVPEGPRDPGTPAATS